MPRLREILFRRTDIRNEVITTLVILAIAGSFREGARYTLPQILISVAVALALDTAGIYIRSRKKAFSRSAVISGLIVALALPPDSAWYLAASGAAAAIVSKHLIRLRGRHIFNPANFGLLVTMFAFSTYLGWWAGTPGWLVALLGAIVLSRFKRLHLVVSYLVAHSAFMVLYSVLKGQNLANSLLLVNFFFAFIMVVEPKTSPARKRGRIVFGVLTALLAAVFITVFPDRDPSILALAVANMFVPVINRKW